MLTSARPTAFQRPSQTLLYTLAALIVFSAGGISGPLKIITARDGKKMVLVQGGTFRMGSERGYREEAPVHSVNVESFYMDQYLVTNMEFRAYCDSTHRAYPPDPRWEEMPGYFLDYPDYPVPVGIFRAVQRPTYEVLLEQQVQEAIAKEGEGNLEALLRQGDIWTVD